LPSQSSARRFVGGALVALVLSGFRSLAAIYCLNRHLGPDKHFAVNHVF
jgi:hypothetical protein